MAKVLRKEIIKDNGGHTFKRKTLDLISKMRLEEKIIQNSTNNKN
jgi:hypothetical protein